MSTPTDSNPEKEIILKVTESITSAISESTNPVIDEKDQLPTSPTLPSNKDLSVTPTKSKALQNITQPIIDIQRRFSRLFPESGISPAKTPIKDDSLSNEKDQLSPLPSAKDTKDSLTPTKRSSMQSLTQPIKRISKYFSKKDMKLNESTDASTSPRELIITEVTSNKEYPINLKNNLNILSNEELILVNLLLELKQEHLFAEWEPPSINDALKHEFLQQISLLNSTYPNGLKAYINRSIELLEASKTGANPLDGWSPSVPTGVVLNDPYSESYIEYETKGKSILNNKIGFIIVAGGLGERLGYSGIKTALPCETTTNTCYLELYISQILAFQNHYCKDKSKYLPFAIMVSDDTYTKTLELLQSNHYFGMQRDQITILKQEKVAALKSSDGKMALINPYAIDSKPHGHGDIHSLMYSTGTRCRQMIIILN